MLKIENTEVCGWEAAIRGMRNPMNSWEKSDSGWEPQFDTAQGPVAGEFVIGPNDLALAKRLRNAGTDHRKFMRMITVTADIVAPLYWYKEYDTYKVGTVANSCSTMHKIHAKEFTLDDFSIEQLLGREDNPFTVSVSSDGTRLSPLGLMLDIIDILNGCRAKYLKTKDKKYWWQMIQLLPSSYNQRRTVMLNYEVLTNIYHARKNHKLDEWHDFCHWVETLPYAKELIIGEEK